MDRLKIKINGIKEELSIKEAREIYNELHDLFAPGLKKRKKDQNSQKKELPSNPFPKAPDKWPKDFEWPIKPQYPPYDPMKPQYAPMKPYYEPMKPYCEPLKPFYPPHETINPYYGPTTICNLEE